MDETTKRLGEALQAAREGRRPKLTQPEAAKALGVGRSTIQNIERGQFVKIASPQGGNWTPVPKRGNRPVTRGYLCRPPSSTSCARTRRWVRP
jgi:DNA-binding XRE family transcriptional regulator